MMPTVKANDVKICFNITALLKKVFIILFQKIKQAAIDHGSHDDQHDQDHENSQYQEKIFHSRKDQVHEVFNKGSASGSITGQQ
jgi:hypothetical protein